MPTEHRQIIFTDPELITALTELRQKRSDAVPAGKITAVEVGASPEIVITIKLGEAAATHEMVTQLPGEIVAAALIRYCIEHKIPMPARATKSLQIFGGSVGIVMISY